MARLGDLVRSAVTGRDAFEDVLGTVVLAAARNGVDVAGGYEVRTRGDLPDLEVQIA
jgi:hypothetical protein